jgi:hypothetical protein
MMKVAKGRDKWAKTVHGELTVELLQAADTRENHRFLFVDETERGACN